MLRVKKEVDLKELEKFGFKFNEYYNEWKCETEDSWETLVIDNKSRCIRFEVSNINVRPVWDYFATLEDNLHILFDLIQAGLVEKVGE